MYRSARGTFVLYENNHRNRYVLVQVRIRIKQGIIEDPVAPAEVTSLVRSCRWKDLKGSNCNDFF
jgi:hypothetical protein